MKLYDFVATKNAWNKFQYFLGLFPGKLRKRNSNFFAKKKQAATCCYLSAACHSQSG
jgi:hypothetical protein